MNLEECQICAENYNRSTRKPITCSYCDFRACNECCKTFLLNETKAHCMNPECNHEWTRKFLADNFTQKFAFQEYKTHREEVLFQAERALLPATQPLVERLILIDNAEREKSKVLDKINGLYKIIRDIDRDIHNLRQNKEQKERQKFVRACPDPECRGFLSSQWKCGLCQKWSCSECHEVKGPSRDCAHTCNPDNIATAQLLSKDTKPCPNCGTGIFKIDGCDQMWCTECHTAFSWRTGQIEKNIHNPHYYEWLRRNSPDGQIPRNPDDIQNRCGDANLHDIAQYLYTISRNYIKKMVNSEDKKTQTEFIDNLSEIIRRIIHIQQVETRRFIYTQLGNNQELRIQYMRNFITEENFKRLIQQNNKKYEKYREIYNLLTMFNTASLDIMLRVQENIKNDVKKVNIIFINSIINIEEIEKILLELEELRKYVNECLKDISRAYKTKPLVLNESYILTTFQKPEPIPEPEQSNTCQLENIEQCVGV